MPKVSERMILDSIPTLKNQLNASGNTTTTLFIIFKTIMPTVIHLLPRLNLNQKSQKDPLPVMRTNRMALTGLVTVSHTVG